MEKITPLTVSALRDSHTVLTDKQPDKLVGDGWSGLAHCWSPLTAIRSPGTGSAVDIMADQHLVLQRCISSGSGSSRLMSPLRQSFVHRLVPADQRDQARIAIAAAIPGYLPLDDAEASSSMLGALQYAQQ